MINIKMLLDFVPMKIWVISLYKLQLGLDIVSL